MLAWMAATALAAPLDPVVRVIVGSSACAGAFIDDRGRVLTAYHCVASGGHPWIATRDGRTAAGRVRSWDVAADLAIVEVPALAGSPWLPVGPVPEPGDAVAVVGHPLANEAPTGYFEGLQRWSVTTGVVSGVGARAIQFDAAVNPGNSGGPVIDAQDRIVSVVSRRLAGQGLGFGARPDAIAAVAAEAPRHPGLGGQLVAGVRLAFLSAPDGGIAIGPRLELSVRDRLILGAEGTIPWQPAFSAARYGSASFPLGAASGGLRQRFGHGPWTCRLDLLGGVATTGQWTSTGDDFRVRSTTDSRPWAGGAIAARGIRFDLSVLPDGTLLSGVGIAWPGTVAVW
jgi:hypothetical protein